MTNWDVSRCMNLDGEGPGEHLKALGVLLCKGEKTEQARMVSFKCLEG